MKKLEQIERHEQKTREKIAALQDILKDIGKQRTEQEDLQIIQKFQALKLSRDELYMFLGGGELPPVLAAALGSTTATPEVIYSQSGKKRRDKPGSTPDADTTGGETSQNENNNTDTENPNFEREGN